MQSLTFGTLAYPGRSISKTLLLLASLRKFGGELAENPVWVLYPEELGEFSEKETASLKRLEAQLFSYAAADELLKFPLGAKVQAAAAAEKLAVERSDLLAWLDEDTLILSPPEEFYLLEGKSLAYRPVHHKLLGISWSEELDAFWQMVYRHCGASPESDFPMETHVGEIIRPYFNAGQFVVRPDRGILSHWWDTFQVYYRDASYRPYYEKDPLYAIFLHQAIFTGTILGALDQEELQPLSPSINYPLHMHREIPANRQARRVDDLVTVRYENVLFEPGWQEKYPFSGELAGWINSRLDQFVNLGDQG
jgi:hypothetical protein